LKSILLGPTPAKIVSVMDRMRTRKSPLARYPEKSARNSEKCVRSAFIVAQMIADALCLGGLSAAVLAYETRLRLPAGSYFDWRVHFLATAAAVIALLTSFARAGVYGPLHPRTWSPVLATTARWICRVILALTGGIFILKISDSVSRFWLIGWAGSSILALGALRLIALYATGRLIRSGTLIRTVAIVGANPTGERLAAILAQDGGGTQIAGVFDDDPLPLETSRACGLAALDNLLADSKVDEIVIAIPVSEVQRIAELIRRFQPFPISLRILAPPGFERFRILGSRRDGNTTTFLVRKKPLDEAACVVKWLEDKVIAALCLTIALPLMLCIALAIKLDTPGPVFFRQRRLGAANRPFDLLKFRSMYVNAADPLGRRLTQAGDPRITRVGAFLRITSLDELPQLINVLRGEMSIVGPRPHPLAAQAGGVDYVDAVDNYTLRQRVKPGMTGWAQVNGWRGETARIEQLRRRIECDLYYVGNWSLTFDLLIIGRTLFSVLSQRNAV
jgi:Undecaprenyl-phosphate glucose phosphotransferase